MSRSHSKILLLDIETAPALAYTWGLWGVNIGIEQIHTPGRILCVGAKWLGDRGCMFFSEWEHGQQGMLEGMHQLLSEAEAVITYNGDRFDLPKLNGAFLEIGLAPPPPPTSIDVFKSVKKLGLISNKLAFVGPFLQLGNKIKHEGFSLWKKVLDGDEAAQKRMTQYCLQDVKLLEKVYRRVRPYIRNHPHTGGAGECGACGSGNTQSRGYRRTKLFKVQRLQCQSCGAWSDGKRESVKASGKEKPEKAAREG